MRLAARWRNLGLRPRVAFSTARGVTAHAIMQQAIRFALAGGVATLVHYAILYTLVEAGRAEPLAASSIGFIAGVIVSFYLNRRFTFTPHTPLLATFAKYVLVYTVGFVLNGFILQTLIGLGWYYFAAQVAATLIVLCWNFLGARFVAFR